MTQDPRHDPPPDLRDGLTVSEEIHCVRCGYNLFKCQLDRPCPECGSPIREMMPGADRVHFFKVETNPPGPLRRIHLAADLSAIVAATLMMSLIEYACFGDGARFVPEYALFLFRVIVVIAGMTWYQWGVRAGKIPPSFFIIGGDDFWDCHGNEGPTPSIRNTRTKRRLPSVAINWRADEIGTIVFIWPFGFYLFPASTADYDSLMRLLAARRPAKTVSWRWFFGVRFIRVMIFCFLAELFFGIPNGH